MTNRRKNILNAANSPSEDAMKRTFTRAQLNGGVTQDFAANVENIREMSRALGTNVLRTPLQRNLLQFTEQFDNAYWPKVNVSIIANATTAPNGTLTADRLIDSAINANHFINNTAITLSLTTHTYSVYVKTNGLQWVILDVNSGGVDYAGYFDVVNGVTGNTIGAGVTLAIQNEGNGWFRCMVTKTIPTASTGVSINPTLSNGGTSGHLGDGVSGYFIWGAQLEVGAIATAYQNPALLPVPQDAYLSENFVYVPSSYGESRNFAQTPNIRNILIFSEDFTNAAWNKLTATIVANTNLNPFGISKSYYMVDSAVNAGFAVSQNKTIVNGTTYTATYYVKKAAHDWIQFAANNAMFGSTLWFNFNLTTGLLGNTGNIGIFNATALPNGWWKISITATSITSANGTVIRINGTGNINTTFFNPGYLGTGANVVDIAAMQFEVGIFSTIYQKQVVAGDGIVDFQFTRATRSSVTNKQGIIEDSCYNLLQRSEEFNNAVWFNFNSGGTTTTITANAINSPIGTLTADLIQYIGTTGANQTTQNITITPFATYTLSVWMKGQVGGEQINISLKSTASSGITGTNFTLTTEWVNYTVTLTNDSGTARGFQFTKVVTATQPNFYVWGAQLEQGSTPRPYLRTTNRLNVPKLDYSRTLAEPSLLIEPIRTNVATWSQDFDNVSWTSDPPAITRVANATLAPDNTMTADKVTEAAALGPQDLYRIYGAVTGQVVFSIFAKSAERNFIQLTLSQYTIPNYIITVFNLATGTVGTQATAGNVTNFSSTITAYPNGWYRCSVTANFPTSLAILNGFYIKQADVPQGAYVGTAGFGIYVWGAQYEIGANPSTYIPTTSATVTRNTESSFVDLFNNAMLNANQYTLFWEGFLIDGQTTGMQVALSDTSTAAANTNQVGWTGLMQPFYNVANVRTNGPILGVNNTLNKFALQYNSGVVNFYLNGENIWPNRTLAAAGYRYLVMNSGVSMYTTDKVALFNRTLTAEECIALTTNAVSLPAFVSTWNTNNTSAGSSTATQVKLPFVASGLYGCIVSWGDGTSSTITVWNQAETTHTYAVAGTYQITIRGVCYGWQFAGTGDRLKFMSVQNWGAFRISNGSGLNSYFNGCANLNLSTVVGILDLTGATTFGSGFQGCTALTTINNFNSWNFNSVTNFNSMFLNCSNFNQTINISVPLLTDSAIMFGNCVALNSPITLSNTTLLTTMNQMFSGCTTMNSLITINTSAVTNMSAVLFGCTVFNQSLSSWNTANVTTFSQAFQNCTNFNQNLNSWNVTKVTIFNQMFQSCTNFNNGLASGVVGTMSWTINTTSPVTMSSMFLFASSFNQDIGAWDVSRVTTMGSMFQSALSFNRNLHGWNVSSCTTFTNMFADSPVFNNGLASGVSGIMSWTLNTTSTVVMNLMFKGTTAFNQDIGSWDVSKVTNMQTMFGNASAFNNGGSPSINGWNTISVINMQEMFWGQGNGISNSFNQPIGNWDMSNVTNISYMFWQNGRFVVFNQDIGSWNVSNVTNATGFMGGRTSGFSTANLDAIYNGWSLLTVKPSVSITFGTLKYTAGASAGRAILVGAPNLWSITDGGI